MGNQQERLPTREYLAGFFDGEGSVGLFLCKAPHGEYLRPEISISQKHGPTTNLISLALNKYGIGNHVSCSFNKSQIHKITISGMLRCEAFIREIAPYTMLKFEELEMLQKFISLRRAVTKNTPYSVEEHAIRFRIMGIRTDRYKSAESSETNTPNAAKAVMIEPKL